MIGWKTILGFLAWILSLVLTVFAVYFTDLFYKPKLLYTATGFEIELPQKYEKELSKIRAKKMIEDLEKRFGSLPKAGTAQPIYKEGKIGFQKSLTIDKKIGFDTDKMRAESKNVDQLIEMVSNPDLLKNFLNSTTSFPTAFATVTINNSGNREATDLDIEIKTNGILIESQITSSEPSIKEFDKLIDPSIGLPVGLTTTGKRLVPDGYIEARIYWHMLPSEGDQDPTPSISVKGTHSKGSLQKADRMPQGNINNSLLIISGIGLFLLGIFLSLMWFLIKKMVSRDG